MWSLSEPFDAMESIGFQGGLQEQIMQISTCNKTMKTKKCVVFINFPKGV